MRLDQGGGTEWPADGVPVCKVAGAQINPQVAPDGSGGAIIVWEDARDALNTDIYAQHLTSTGVPFVASGRRAGVWGGGVPERSDGDL